MKLKDTYTTQQVADVYLAMAQNKENQNRVLRMNKTGARILELLHKETTEEAIADQLCKEFEGERAAIQESIHRFVEQLKSNGLV